MTFDLDIYHAAKLLIGRHGDEAALYAADRADLCFKRATSRVLQRGGRLSGQPRSCSGSAGRTAVRSKRIP
jgi:hypothetical protein